MRFKQKFYPFKFLLLKALINELPDIRTDKVEQLKKAIDTGFYNIDSYKVAEKMLEEI